LCEVWEKPTRLDKSLDPLETWVRSTLPRALGYARSLLGDSNAAEDVVQDCYAKLIERQDRYDLPKDGLKILLRSITNSCIDLRTRERLLFGLPADQDSGESRMADSRSPDPLEETVARELEDRVETELANLPIGQRAVIHLTSIGYSFGDVADFLGTTRANVRVLLYRARKALEVSLKPFLQGKSP